MSEQDMPLEQEHAIPADASTESGTSASVIEKRANRRRLVKVAAATAGALAASAYVKPGMRSLGVPVALAGLSSPPPPPPPAAPVSCPATPGFWKNWSTNSKGNQRNLWPSNSLTLGCSTYTEAELVGTGARGTGLFNISNPSNSGDASMILAYQLMAAKLNVLAKTMGSGASSVTTAISNADSLLCQAQGSTSNRLPYNIAPSSSLGARMVSVASTLDAFNNSNPAGCLPLV